MEQKDRFMEALRKLNEIESSRIVLSLAIYDKKLQEIKTRKLDNIRSSLEAKIYYLPKKIKDEKEKQIDEIINQYEEAIDDILSAYNTQNIKIQKYLQESEIAQKYTISEIIKIYKDFKSKKDTLDDFQKQVIIKKVQTKLNYDVIIDECEARIELCLDNAVNTLEENFEDISKEIKTIEKESFIFRVFRLIKSFISKKENTDNIFEGTKEKLSIIRENIQKRMNEIKCEIVGFDISTAPKPLHFDRMESISSLKEYISDFDIIVITAPLLPSTYHLIAEDVLMRLKENAILVNIARGGLIDENYLCDFLRKRPDIYAALDVFESEPLDAASLLWKLNNVAISPHNSFVSDGNNERMFNVIYTNLKNFIA